jgi:hypothetical protein
LNGPVSVRVYLDAESRALLEAEAGSHGLSLSAYLRVFARTLKIPAKANTPVLELRARFREILDQERRHASR